MAMTIEDLRNALDFPDAPWPDVDSAIYFLLTVDEAAGEFVASSAEVAEALDISDVEVRVWAGTLSRIGPNPIFSYKWFLDRMYVPDHIHDLLAKEYPSCL